MSLLDRLSIPHRIGQLATELRLHVHVIESHWRELVDDIGPSDEDRATVELMALDDTIKHFRDRAHRQRLRGNHP